MKAYTDLVQSKKLAEILPLESADMHYITWAVIAGEFIVYQNQKSTILQKVKQYLNED